MWNNNISIEFFEDLDLPKKLKAKEIQELFIEYKNGSQEARNKIISHNIRLVLYVLQRYNNLEKIKDQLFEDGVLGLIKAVDTYDIDKKINFATYAIKCINNEILMFLRKNKNQQAISLNEIMYTKNEGADEITLEEMLFDDSNLEEELENKELYKTINILVDNLPEREKEICKLHFGFYGKVYTQIEIAEKLNLSQSYISRLIPKILSHLEYELNNSGVYKSNIHDISKKLSTKQKNYDNSIIIKKPKSIYEFFPEHSKEKINAVIKSLSDKDKKIIELRYGKDLENPIFFSLNKTENGRFYNNILLKIRNRLKKEDKYDKIIKNIPEGDTNMNKENNENIKTKGIYKRFNEFTAIDINEAFSALPEKYQSIVLKYYGKNLDSDPKRGLLTKEEQIILNKAIMFLNRRLTNKTNFYTRFAGTTQEEIDKILHDSFNEKEINILKKFHNGDLSRPRLNRSLTKEETKQYKAIIRKLDNYFKQMQEIKPRLKTVKKSESETERIKPAMVVKEDKTDAFLSVHNDSEEEKELTTKAEIIKQQIQVEEAVVQVEKNTQEAKAPVEIPVEETKEEIFEEPVAKELLPVKEVVQETTVTKISNDDYTDILQYLNNPMFRKMTKNLPEKEFVIISLLFGYVNGKYFSVDSISEFLDIEEIDILNMAKKALIEYKEEVSKMLDSAIQLFDNKNYVREKKPEENN